MYHNTYRMICPFCLSVIQLDVPPIDVPLVVCAYCQSALVQEGRQLITIMPRHLRNLSNEDKYNIYQLQIFYGQQSRTPQRIYLN